MLCKTFMGFMQRIKVFIRCSYIKYYKVKRNLYRKLLRVYQICKQKCDADKYKIINIENATNHKQIT